MMAAMPSSTSRLVRALDRSPTKSKAHACSTVRVRVRARARARVRVRVRVRVDPNPNQVTRCAQRVRATKLGLGLGSELRRHLVERAGGPRDEAPVARRGREDAAAAAGLLDAYD